MYIFAQFLCFSSCQEPLVGSGNTWVSGNMWTWWVGRKRSICHRKEHESITLWLWLFLFVTKYQNGTMIVVFVTEMSVEVLHFDFDLTSQLYEVLSIGWSPLPTWDFQSDNWDHQLQVYIAFLKNGSWLVVLYCLARLSPCGVHVHCTLCKYDTE